jgi:HK97 family phage major capsid protein
MADITRAEVASLIAEEYAGTVISSAEASSSALAAFPTYNMGTKTTHIPVLATLPAATWVTDTDNTGVKDTAQVTWSDKTLVAEEVAVIIPIHENTLDDATENILEEIAGLGGQAIGKTLDEAVFFGVNKPSSWTSDDLLTAASGASQDFEVNATTGADDLYGSILLAAEALSDAGFDATSLIARNSLRFKLRNLRENSSGAPILVDGVVSEFDTTWNRNGAWDADEAYAFVVDPSRVRIGVRQDVTVKFLDQATLTGVGNLAEKDMVALRFKARFAYVLGTGATSEGASKVPVASVIPAGS